MYIRQGDRNTMFFHILSKRNAKRNFVASIIKHDGTLTTLSSEILDEFVRYYKGLLGRPNKCRPLDQSVFDYGPCLGDTERDNLYREMTEEEI